MTSILCSKNDAKLKLAGEQKKKLRITNFRLILLGMHTDSTGVYDRINEFPIFCLNPSFRFLNKSFLFPPVYGMEMLE
jgi:hypothetical protein